MPEYNMGALKEFVAQGFLEMNTEPNLYEALPNSFHTLGTHRFPMLSNISLHLLHQYTYNNPHLVFLLR